MDNILKLNLIFKVRGPAPRRHLPYSYNKNTNLQSSYTTIYIPRYVRLNPKNSARPYRLLKEFMRYPPDTIENLHKAQAIFLDTTKLEKFMKFILKNRANKSNRNDTKIVDDNTDYIFDLFFQKLHPFYIKNTKYTISDIRTAGKNCNFALGNKTRLREDAHFQQRIDIHKNIEALYKRHGYDINTYAKQIKKESDADYNALTVEDKERYVDNYLKKYEKKSDYKCEVTINLKPVKSFTLKQKLKQIKTYMKNYHKVDCKTKKRNLQKEWDALCSIKSLNTMNVDDLWDEMCLCSNCNICKNFNPNISNQGNLLCHDLTTSNKCDNC